MRTQTCILFATLALASAAFASGPCPCATDLNNDGVTDAPDLALLLGAWGGNGLADFDGNGSVDASDLAILLGAWGPCAPPANDNCAQAIVLTGEIVVEPFCNSSATDSPVNFPSSCDGDAAAIGKDIWYRYTTPYSGMLIVDTYGSEFDTVLGVYGNIIPGGCSCPTNGIGTAILLACDDDTSTDVSSFVEFPIDAGECLNIRVGGYNFGGGDVDEGPGQLLVRPIKTGDRCDIANQLPAGEHVSAIGTNAGDTWLQIDQSSCATNDTIDEWYRYVVPCTGTVFISTCDDVTDFDTTLAVFADCGGSEIACNDDSSTPGCQLNGLNRKSEVSINGGGGEVIYIRVSGYQGAVGTFKLKIDVSCIG